MHHSQAYQISRMECRFRGKVAEFRSHVVRQKVVHSAPVRLVRSTWRSTEWMQRGAGLPAMARRVGKGLLFLFFLLLVGCDHATKLAAERTLADGARSVVPGVLDLHLSHNEGIAFSLLRDVSLPSALPGKSVFLIAIAALSTLAVGFFWWRRRKAASALEHFSWAGILGGAVANVVDRAARGYVVDFLQLPHWPVFNVADICVVIGMIGLILTQLTAVGRARQPDA